jgi:N-acetylneuraminate lyase
VGHNSLAEARQLAAHAQSIGADVVSATCPSYFEVDGVELLVDCMEQIAGGAPELPYYYYHIPGLTGADLDMVDFLEQGGRRIPNLAGLKFTSTQLPEYQRCLELDGNFDVVWGVDEMLLSALGAGARGAIGSTFNVAAPLYLRLIEAFDAGHIEEARRLQSLAVQMISTLSVYPFHSAMKELLKMLGLDCGPCRLPLRPIPPVDVLALHSKLESIGFFDWSGSWDGSRPHRVTLRDNGAPVAGRRADRST